MTVLVSVLGDTVTVLGGSVVVGVSVLDGGTVSVTVWVGAGAPPPPPPWCRGSWVVVVTGVVVDGVVVVVVVAGLCAGELVASLTAAKTTAPSSSTPSAPKATSAAGRRYQGVGGSGGGRSSYPPYSLYPPPYRAAWVGSE
ncbi:hypothetical protein O981_21520 [Mycobacterium avium 10-5560]|nr:hypothetical protein O981_21520 [Mycobacterium avium 10-5560]ETZ48954.1 hypothetical protein L839_3070 [Mycobacterium avium MAV_120809_2495]ETZ54887.1 hypothetical protein L840_4244 [Mycobacterium sp. MAC_011194_8550]ETZ59203.1 hypothetical protein L841_4607 [Mycobacterium sp. MAC_080597_8934]KDP11481.1 hypothetical protein MAV100_01315 [Mycobacterium avium subsp. hominissuis 100]